MNSVVHDAPVLIAGAGPVGTTLALDLASRGTPSILLEERTAQPPNPRCNTTNARSMEFYRRLGLADEIRNAGLPANHPTDVVYVTSLTGPELTRYRLPASSMARANRRDRADGEGSLDDGWPTPEPQHRISQLFLEPILHRRADELDEVDFRKGWRFDGYEQDESGLIVTATDLGRDVAVELRCRYLVGAEGARSIVRRTMGASFEGNPSVARSLSTYLRCRQLGEISQQLGGWMYRVIGPTRYHRFVAIDGADDFIYHLTLQPDDDVADVDLAAALAEALGQPAEFEVLGQVDWVARAMVADRFSDQNVFLVGDAAHIWIPMGGFGMNAGVADATNLSWKLTAAVDGWGGPELLASYEAERKPMGETVARAAVGINTDLMDAIRTADGIHADDARAERARRELGETIAAANTTEFNSIGMQLGYYYDDSPVVVGDGSEPPPFSLGDYEVTSWPGTRAPHFWLENEVSLYDRLGRFFTLLVLHDSTLNVGDAGSDSRSDRGTVASFLEAANDVELPIELLEIDSGDALDLYEGYEYVLVRPDQHIGWRGERLPDDPAELLRQLTGN